jgi:hypothetical protein
MAADRWGFLVSSNEGHLVFPCVAGVGFCLFVDYKYGIPFVMLNSFLIMGIYSNSNYVDK